MITVRHGNVEILCDRCIETDGMWVAYQGGVPIKKFVNIPIEVEGEEDQEETDGDS